MKASYTEYSRDGNKLGRIWEIKDKDDKLVKTVCFTYCEDESTRISFIIIKASGNEAEYAVVIDNKDWDLLCFATDYTRESIVKTCWDYITWVKAMPHYVSATRRYTYANEDELMDVIS